jgi:glycerol kinase
MIDSAPEISDLALTVDDNGGVYFVPAFSGLFAPWWRDDARGVFTGLTRFVNRGHIARAVLEATAFQARDVIEAMEADSGVPLSLLKVDGGMVANEILMQFQADLLDVDVVRPKTSETTVLGAAYAAGLAVGFWESLEEIATHWEEDRTFSPSMEPAVRDRYWRNWHKAVERSMGWVEDERDETA